MASVEQILGHILDRAVLEGYLTPLAASEGPAHSAGFLGFRDLNLPCLPISDSALAVDLGTGGGLPGLVLAATTPWRWLLVDRRDRRVVFLRWAVRQLGIEGRVKVVLSDAADVGRGGSRGMASLVTARGFAPPGSTAECAAPLLAEHGVLVVSEPPTKSTARWPEAGLCSLGLRDVGGWATDELSGSANYRAMVRVKPCSDRFPRRFHRQVADPLF